MWTRDAASQRPLGFYVRVDPFIISPHCSISLGSRLSPTLDSVKNLHQAANANIAVFIDTGKRLVRTLKSWRVLRSCHAQLRELQIMVCE